MFGPNGFCNNYCLCMTSTPFFYGFLRTVLYWIIELLYSHMRDVNFQIKTMG